MVYLFCVRSCVFEFTKFVICCGAAGALSGCLLSAAGAYKSLRSVYTTSLWWLAAASKAAVILATLAGNACVLGALARLRRAPAHYALASLAAADLLLGLCVLPLTAARELFVFQLNYLLCSCWNTLDVLCCTASILSICLLGWERWRGITAPFARARRAQQARLFSALVWPVSAAVAIPTAFVPFNVHEEVPRACSVNNNVVYVFVSAFFSFYLPAVVMLAMYVQIARALAAAPAMPMRAHRGRISNDNSNTVRGIPQNEARLSFIDKIKKVTVFSPQRGKHLNVPGAGAAPIQTETAPEKSMGIPNLFHSRQKRATRAIVLLMALFLVCWSPFFIMLPLDALCVRVSDIAQQWCTWLGYVNSALNPLVYAAASPSIRRALHVSFSSRTTDLAAERAPCVRLT